MGAAAARAGGEHLLGALLARIPIDKPRAGLHLAVLYTHGSWAAGPVSRAW